MALPKKFNKFNNKNSKPKIRVSHCEAKKALSKVTGQEKEYLEAYIDGVIPTDRQQLINLWSASIPNSVLVAVPHPNYDKGIILKINIDKINEIGTNFIDKLNDAIKSFGKYDDNSVDTFGEILMDKINQCPTEADIANTSAKIASNWKEMLDNLQDPAFRQRLLNFQTTQACARKYGHMLSKKNVMNILSQNPMASFVTTADTWRNVFNRQIKPGAEKFIVTMPTNYGNASFGAMDNAARANGFGGVNDAKKATNSATQVMNKIRIDANHRNSGFYKVIMYDVADTIPPADPKDDVWSNEMGLLNNLTGILNDKAQADSDAYTANLGQVQQAQPVSNGNVSSMKKRRGWLEWVCKKNNIATLQNANDEAFIVDATYQYSKLLAKKLGNVKPQDIEKVAAISTLLVAISSGINEKDYKIISSIGGNLRVTDDDAMTIFTITDSIIPTMAKKISEGKIFEHKGRDLSVDDLIRIAIDRYGLPEEQIEEQKKIKNDFVDLLNRMIEQ